MRLMVSALVAGMIAFPALASASTPDPQPWYLTHPAAVKTLKQAIREEHDFFKKSSPTGQDNPYWHGHTADAATCAALASVGLACDYNTRGEISMFLTVNGKGLFPAHGHTNPYCSKENYRPDDCFIGHGRQNAMLATAVQRNAILFHNGDLSAADVRTKWR